MAKQLMGRRRLYKITEWRDEAVYKTKLLGEIWISLNLEQKDESRIAQEAGGDTLGSCPYDGRDHVQKIDTQKEWIPAVD